MVAGYAAIQQRERGSLRFIRACEIGRVTIFAAAAGLVDLFIAALGKVPLFHGRAAPMCFISDTADGSTAPYIRRQ